MTNLIIVGDGDTSRANVEALIEDHFYANPDTTVYMVVVSELSRGQAFASQFSKDKSKQVIEIAQNQITSDIATNADAFVLWNPENATLQEIVVALKTFGVRLWNLCDGLVPIEINGEGNPPPKIVEPVKEEVKILQTLSNPLDEILQQLEDLVVKVRNLK